MYLHRQLQISCVQAKQKQVFPTPKRAHRGFLIGSHEIKQFKKTYRMTLSTTLLGTNISLSKAVLKMSFLFPRWDMLIPWRVSMIRHVLQPGFSFCTHGPSPKPSSSQVARVEQIKRNTLSSANLGFSRWWLNQPF